MADPGDSSGASGASWLEKLKSYVRTQKGMILSAEIVVSLIVLICYAASMYGGYSAVAICEMIFAIVFFIIFMMELDKQFVLVNWMWTDLFRAGIGAVLYLITSLICVIGGAGDGARIAGGVFGLIAGLIFAYDTYTLFLQVRSTRQHTAASTEDRV
ncbi:proteolipid protein 2b [Limanda limanda]|uniref:proteolipid protein 2b n=1 Tax=Limanda limanda TaxID=27771 RepID=UPI0029C6441E|nr:proteolipid protein 2b [Limanda limanda]